jgi:Phage head-tail joining protein
MGIGDFNKVVTFKQNTPTQKGAGKADAYTTLLTTRGKVEFKNSSRGTNYGEIKNTSDYWLTVRWEEDLDNLDFMKMKVVYDSKTFQINSAEKIGEKRFYLKFSISEDGSTVSAAPTNWTGFIYNQATGVATFTGATGSDYLTQIAFEDVDTGFTYVNGFNEAFSISAISGSTARFEYLTPGDVKVKWRLVSSSGFSPLTDWAEYTLTVTRIPRRRFVLYDFDSNTQFTSALFPAKPIDVGGAELTSVSNMADFITTMNADATNQAAIELISYVETSRIDVEIDPVSPYQDYNGWNRILKAKRG